ncbi:zona pellucida sperm-binding protein 4-like [Bufo gargarizans]|uniref:zona pellucida sperm-binding protein 4-like n=1 Tax=Bufo gargarizans TaxID=30331 RepID=UPI001CF5312C|nr:zona pellucida sperm-binding protein 4-like [Bufo gargarizans]
MGLGLKRLKPVRLVTTRFKQCKLTFLSGNYKGKSQNLRNDSDCGFWIGRNLDGSMTIGAAYDGCYVREEHGDYVMTVLVEHIKNGQVKHHKKDIKCPALPALDAPSSSDCAAVQRSDRIECANSSVPQDVCGQLGCCFSPGDLPHCYYGNKLTARCTDEGQVLIVLSKELMQPSLILESVLVLGVDSSCPQMKTSNNSAFIIVQFPLSCGGGSRVSGTSTIYENTVEATVGVKTWQGSSFTTDSTMRLTVRCSYSQTSNVPFKVEVLTLQPPHPVSTTGPLQLEMRIAKDVDYAKYYTENEYPVTKILQDPVFLEVRIMSRTDPSLVLMLDDCWATSTPDATQQVQWPILINGCALRGDNYMTGLLKVGAPSQSVPYPTHYQRFVISTFTFVDPNDQHSLGGLVYVHCRAVVCDPSATESCSTFCDQRKKRDIKKSGEKITVSKGPVNFIDLEMPSHMRNDLSLSTQAGDMWDYNTQNETSEPDFVGAEKEDPMDGGLIGMGKNFPRRVKGFDSDSSTLMWLRAAAVGGGFLAVIVALLGLRRCHRSRTPTMYSVRI